jgi:rubredoxin
MTFDGEGSCPFPSLLAQPPDAFLDYQLRNRHGFLEPAQLYYRPVSIWAPELFYRVDLPLGLSCPVCKAEGWHYNKGWIDEAVPLYDIDSTFSLMSRRYECRLCGVKFTGHSPEVVQLLPRHVQDMADFVKVGRSYVTTRFVRVVRDHMADGGNMAGAHRRRRH